MKQSDYEPFVSMLKEAAEYFRDNQPLTEARIAIYWKSLESYDFKRVCNAMMALYESRKFDGLPKAADLLESIKPEYKEPEKIVPMTPEQAMSGSIKGRFNLYLIRTGKWKDVSDQTARGDWVPNTDKWVSAFEAWESAGQPMPSKVETRRGIFKAMEA